MICPLMKESMNEGISFLAVQVEHMELYHRIKNKTEGKSNIDSGRLKSPGQQATAINRIKEQNNPLTFLESNKPLL